MVLGEGGGTLADWAHTCIPFNMFNTKFFEYDFINLHKHLGYLVDIFSCQSISNINTDTAKMHLFVK